MAVLGREDYLHKRRNIRVYVHHLIYIGSFYYSIVIKGLDNFSKISIELIITTFIQLIRYYLKALFKST